jgi:hypothetical protein
MARNGMEEMNWECVVRTYLISEELRNLQRGNPREAESTRVVKKDWMESSGCCTRIRWNVPQFMTLVRGVGSWGIRGQSVLDDIDSVPGCNRGTLRIRSVA